MKAFKLITNLYAYNLTVQTCKDEKFLSTGLDHAFVVTVFNLILPIVLLGYAALYAIGGELWPIPTGLMILCSFLSSLATPIFHKTKSYEITINYFLFTVFLAVAPMSYFTGGALSPNQFWLIVIPFYSALFLKRNSSIFWSLLVIAEIIFYAALNPTKEFLLHKGNELFITYFHFFTIAFSFYVYSFIYKRMTDNSIEEHKNAHDKINTLLRVLGHDLSNPLMLALMKTDRLISKDGEIQKKDIRVVYNACKRMESIIRNIQRYNKIKDGKFSPQLVPLSISDTIEESLELFSEQILNKKITVEVSGEKEAIFLADKDVFVHQIFNNIFSNAIKFSKQAGRIEVNIESTPEHVIIGIADEGEGVPDHFKQSLFNFQESQSTDGTLGEQGTGYGLPLAKTFAEAFGGSVYLSSSKAQLRTLRDGSFFCIKLPKVDIM